MNGPDSPMFRGRRSPTTPTAPRPVLYRKDVNSQWTQDDAGLIVTESDATKRKILNVLCTLLGEEYFEPTIGSLITHRLFENITTENTYLVEGDTIGALGAQMRDEITLYHNQCRVSETDDGEGFAILLVYDEIFSNGPAETWHFALRKSASGYVYRTL